MLTSSRIRRRGDLGRGLVAKCVAFTLATLTLLTLLLFGLFLTCDSHPQITLSYTNPTPTPTLPSLPAPHITLPTPTSSFHYWNFGAGRVSHPPVPLAQPTRYVTFEPWGGLAGLSNMRMSLEIAAAFAMATGRVLVVPSEPNILFLGRTPMEDIVGWRDLTESNALSVIPMPEFRSLMGLPPFVSQKTLDRAGSDDVPQGATTNEYEGIADLDSVAVVPIQDSGASHRTIYCVPSCPGVGAGGLDSAEEVRKAMELITAGNIESYPVESLDEAGWNQAEVVHFDKSLLGNFYRFFWFADTRVELDIKRVIRNHIHYPEHLFETSQTLVQTMGPSPFTCLHVRRNDFQFKDSWTGADSILKAVAPHLYQGENLYIATDEADAEFFAPLIEEREAAGGSVFFLSDRVESAGLDVPSTSLPQLDQIVCARGRLFFGTRLSTFTGYIHRLRGYMPDIPNKQLLFIDQYFPTSAVLSWSPNSLSRRPDRCDWCTDAVEAWEGL